MSRCRRRRRRAATNGGAPAPHVAGAGPRTGGGAGLAHAGRRATAANVQSRTAPGIAGGEIPDVVRPDDAIGATHLDDRYFAALPGIRGRILRRLPLSVSQPLEVLARGRFYDAVLTWSDRPAVVLGTLMLGWKRRPAHVAILMWPSKPKKAIPLLLAAPRIDRFVACAPLQRRFLLERLRIAPERLVEVGGRRVDTDFWRPADARATDTISSVGQEMRDYSTLVAAVDSLEVPCHIAPGAGIVGASAAKWWSRSLEGRELPANVTVGRLHLRGAARPLRALAVRRRSADPLRQRQRGHHDPRGVRDGQGRDLHRSPGRAGVIEDGRDRAVRDAGRPDRAAQGDPRAVERPERCERMGAAAREYVVANHGIDRWTDSLVEAIDGAVATRAHAGARDPEGARSTHSANWDA